MRWAALALLAACGGGDPPPAPPAPAVPEPTAAPGPTAGPSLAEAIGDGVANPLPVPLRMPDCTDACTEAQAVERALVRAAGFLADGEGEARMDAAIGLYAIRQVVAHPDLDRAWERARAGVDGDADHLHRRLFDPDATRDKPTNAWPLPVGDAKPNLNRVVGEALWCDVYPLRPEVLATYSGAMLDGGGYFSTHAAWALAMARDRGCVDGASFATHAAPIAADLRAHQPGALAPSSVGDVDLFAERLLGLVQLGESGPDLDRAAAILVALQHDDGGWGQPSEDEHPYLGIHAALASSWALTEWSRAKIAD